jgi:hypothetical protein
MSLTNLIHRIASDQSFANRFAQDPAAALASAGLDLSEEERRALQTLLSRPGWQDLFSPANAGIDSYPWLTSQTVAA